MHHRAQIKILFFTFYFVNFIKIWKIKKKIPHTKIKQTRCLYNLNTYIVRIGIWLGSWEASYEIWHFQYRIYFAQLSTTQTKKAHDRLRTRKAVSLISSFMRPSHYLHSVLSHPLILSFSCSLSFILYCIFVYMYTYIIG